MSNALIQLKVVEALDKIGKTNGTKLPDIDPPAELAGQNSAIELWNNERKATFDLMIAQQINSYAERRVKKAKSKVDEHYAAEISNTKPGTSNTFIRGDVALNVEVRRASERLDTALLISAMIKHGVSVQDAEKIINEGTVKNKAPTYYRTSLVS